MAESDAKTTLDDLRRRHEASLESSRREAATALYKPGNMVWCNFPYDDAPNAPAKERHACLYMGTVKLRNGETRLQMVYTTSQAQQRADTDQHYHIRVGAADAKAAGDQRPFVVCAEKVALLPATREFFPNLVPEERERGYGLVGHAGPHIRIPTLKAIVRLEKEEPGPNRTLRVYGPESSLTPRPSGQPRPLTAKMPVRGGWER